MKRLAVLVTLSLFAACGADSGTASCNADGGTDLTYANFGASFMSSYCSACHGNWSSLASVVASKSAIVSHAGTSSDMPPGGASSPSAAERANLVQWLSCGTTQ